MANPTRLWLLAALALLLALLTVPTLGSQAQEPEPETLTLEVNGDSGSFTYSGQVDAPQPFAPDKGCEVNIAGALVNVTGNKKAVGANSNGLGVKSGNSNGTPCGRVEANAKNTNNGERLTVSLDGVPAAESAELDLELKGDVDLKIDLYRDEVLTETFTILAGGLVSDNGAQGSMEEPFGVTVESPVTTGNCRNDSDAGPDSGIRDNCRATIVPASPFDSLRLRPVAGEVSLEGGGDFAGEILPEGFDPTTIFTLNSMVYDGEIGCDESNNSTDLEIDGVIEGQIFRYANTNGEPCILKPYTLVVTANDPDTGTESVTFEVDDPIDPPQQAIYYAELTFFDDPGQPPLDTLLEYDPDGSNGYDDFRSTQSCVEDPEIDLVDGNPADGVLNPNAIPGWDPNDPLGEKACVYSVSHSYTGVTVWKAIFAGDWKFR